MMCRCSFIADFDREKFLRFKEHTVAPLTIHTPSWFCWAEQAYQRWACSPLTSVKDPNRLTQHTTAAYRVARI
jgi:hypothetical protein